MFHRGPCPPAWPTLRGKVIMQLAIKLHSDGSSGQFFTTAVAVVFAVVEFFTATVVVAVFGCLITTVAVVSCDEYENYFC